MKNKPAPSFEECIEEIDREIAKRRRRWTLTALSWMDFDDISQILRIHIHKKWQMYDPTKPLAPWINTIISHQIKNLIRNNYGNYSRPCLRCAAAEGDNLCAIYTQQCNNCPLYAYWERHKKQAHDVKLPLPLENHAQEVSNQTNDFIDVERTAINIHNYMKHVLKPIELKLYTYLYVHHYSEIDTARLMGYKTNEKGRNPGYKQMKNLKKIILHKVKKALYEGKVDMVNYG